MLWDSLLAITTGLAQAEPNAGPPWWKLLLDDAFAIGILFIFLTAVLGMLVNQRRKDKCLKLLRGYHVTFAEKAGGCLWGDLLVYPKAMEVVFDRPYTTRSGLIKSSALIHEAKASGVLMLCRTIDALPRDEQNKRQRQVQRRFNPNVIRRALRWLRNMMNTLRDAFSQALSQFVGQITKAAKGGMLTQQRSGVEQIGNTLLGAAGNTYEPMLEAHIGRPVVVQIQCPDGEGTRPIDLPGYLADYTKDYLALFNLTHEAAMEKTLPVQPNEPWTQAGVSLSVQNQQLTIKCTGPELVVVKSVRAASLYAEPEVVLPFGVSVLVTVPAEAESIDVRVQLTRRVDAVIPRALAKVDYGGGMPEDLPSTTRNHGLAPEQVVEDESDDPAQPA